MVIVSQYETSSYYVLLLLYAITPRVVVFPTPFLFCGIWNTKVVTKKTEFLRSRWWKPRDPTVIRSESTPACDRQTDSWVQQKC